MDIESFREYCLSLPFSEETLPFDDNTLVFKIGGRMYAVCTLDNFDTISVKCDPEKAIVLREEYPEVLGAFHFNKKHWNSLDVRGDLTTQFIKEQIRNSYIIVIEGVAPKQKREDLIEAIRSIDSSFSF